MGAQCVRAGGDVPGRVGEQLVQGRLVGRGPFHRGLAALAQYIAREGHHRVPRAHIEEIAVEGQNHGHWRGIWYGNLRSRRDRLAEPQRAALTELGVDWV